VSPWLPRAPASPFSISSIQRMQGGTASEKARLRCLSHSFNWSSPPTSPNCSGEE
jgi:hypothetical protein